jgi:uncharacterized protein YdaU (DUF1376 family)
MSKDPAILFYTADFRQGTLLLSDEQTGQYIRLLCDQHQNGHLPDQHILNVCKTYDSPVLKKFIRDENGFWYNKRMQLETIKRVSYCDSRKRSRFIGIEKQKNKQQRTSQHTLLHTSRRMDNDNDNENDNRNVNDCLTGYNRGGLGGEEKEPENASSNIYRSFAHLKITIEEKDKILSKGYTKEELDSILIDIENYKKNTNYLSLYLTALKWLKNNKDKNLKKEIKIFDVNAYHEKLKRDQELLDEQHKSEL